MHHNAVAKLEDIAGAIEVWEDKVNMLAKHCDDYRLPGTFRKLALEQMLVGKVREHFELLEAEKLSFEELLKKVKEQARANNLDEYAQTIKSGVAMGPNLGNQNAWQERHEHVRTRGVRGMDQFYNGPD